MKSSRYIVPALLVILGLAGGAFLVSQGFERGTRLPEHATVLPVPQPLPDFTLTDHRGEPLTRESLTGGWQLLFFGFTNCPDICPATLQQLAVARRQLAAAGISPLPDIVFISVDPARDSPAQLADYVGHFGAGVVGATGRDEALRSLAASLGVYFEVAGSEAGGDYTVSHSAAVLVIDDAARLYALFSAPHDVDAFVNDLALLLSIS